MVCSSGVEALVDLGAQAGDVHVDHVGLRIEVIFPDAFEQHGAGDDLPGVAHQIFEQAELARLQVDGLAVTGGGAGEQVEFEFAHRQFVFTEAGERRRIRASMRASSSTNA